MCIRGQVNMNVCMKTHTNSLQMFLGVPHDPGEGLLDLNFTKHTFFGSRQKHAVLLRPDENLKVQAVQTWHIIGLV